MKEYLFCLSVGVYLGHEVRKAADVNNSKATLVYEVTPIEHYP